MPLVIEMSDEDVHSWCGTSSRTPPEKAIMSWLYDDPRFSTAREIALGRALVQRMTRQIINGGGSSEGG